jgi:hypothetical protein
MPVGIVRKVCAFASNVHMSAFDIPRHCASECDRAGNERNGSCVYEVVSASLILTEIWRAFCSMTGSHRRERTKLGPEMLSAILWRQERGCAEQKAQKGVEKGQTWPIHELELRTDSTQLFLLYRRRGAGC